LNEPFDIDAQPALPTSAGGLLSRIGTMMVSLAEASCPRRDLPDHRGRAAITSRFSPPTAAINEKRRTLQQAALVSVDRLRRRPVTTRAKRGCVPSRDAGGRDLSRPGRAHQRVNINAVLMKDNLAEMEGLIQIAGKYGALFMVQPYGFLKTGSRDPMPEESPSETLLELSRRYPHFNSNPEFLRKFDQHITVGVGGCRAGRSFFNIDQWGNISKCVEYREESLGKVQEMSAEQIWAALTAEHRANSCTACWYNCRGEIESLYTARGLRTGLPKLFAMPSAHCSIAGGGSS
jgi:MoaA/NifB/PqqE/SkfB family radical SAM enzyme